MTVDIVRAWKDPEYRKTLTPEQLASLPPTPSGTPTLTEDDMTGIVGGEGTCTCLTTTCKPPEKQK